MRMWMVDPRIMCRNHLLGEHAELHLFAWSIDQKRSVKGYLRKGLLEIHNLHGRHEELAKEMRRRGYQHSSDFDEKWKHAERWGSINKERSLAELINRCPKCKKRSNREQN